MAKYVFWNVLHVKASIALTESLARYARGETFWQALGKLLEETREISPSPGPEESGPEARLRMFQETGINKVEIFVEGEGKGFSVRCANSRSLLEVTSEAEALRKYVAVRARTSLVNAGEPGP